MEAKRRVGVAMDFSPCSQRALKWAADNILRDGDNLIILNVRHEQKSGENETPNCGVTGSPLIPFQDFYDHAILKKYGVNPDPATMEILQTVTAKKDVTVVMKIYWGSAGVKLCESIDQLPLTCIILGHRGHGLLERAMMGSVSNHVVNNGACTVTVVKEYR